MSQNETAPEQFEWSELNRAEEILRFFDWVEADFLRNVDPKIIAELKLILASKLYEVLIRKYQLTDASINQETAINIIDEQKGGENK